MAKAMSMKDFYDIISSQSNVSIVTAKRIWGNFMELIISELQNNSYILIDNFGKFETVRKGGTDEDWYNQELGIVTKRYVNPYDYVEFTPSKNFINTVNCGIIDIYKNNRLKDDNGDIVDLDIMTTLMQTNPSLEENMQNILKRKKKRRVNEVAREKLYKNGETLGNDKTKPKPIRVYDNHGGSKEYPSINSCANDLNIRAIKIFQQIEKGNMEIEGYKFELISEEEDLNG